MGANENTSIADRVFDLFLFTVFFFRQFRLCRHVRISYTIAIFVYLMVQKEQPTPILP